MAEDPAGKLANGALFVPPAFYNLPNAGFGYANLNDQMLDASRAWALGAGVFAGNNVPKYNGLPGSDPNGTFGGGFATMAPNVGGSTAGASAYSGGFNPFAGRGNGGGVGAGGGGAGGAGGTPINGIPPAGVGTVPPVGGNIGNRNNSPDERGRYNVAPTGQPTTPLPGGMAEFARQAGGSPQSTATTNQGMAGLLNNNALLPPLKSGLGMGAGNAAAQGNPAEYWGNNLLPAQGTNTDLLARTMAASNDWNVGGTGLQGLLGSNAAMHQAGNAYNAGGSRYGGTWDTNYAAVAQNPGPYVAAGIATANGDGTYTMNKLQDPESQQWIPIADFYAKYGK